MTNRPSQPSNPAWRPPSAGHQPVRPPVAARPPQATQPIAKPPVLHPAHPIAVTPSAQLKQGKIEQASRHDGVVYLVVPDHGLDASSVGKQITVSGVFDPSFNVTAPISRIVSAEDHAVHTICFEQPGVIDRHAALTGGEVAVA